MPEFRGLWPLIQVFDMNEAVAFYRDKLSFEVAQHSPYVDAAEGHYFHWCQLRRGGAELMLNTLYDANERPSERDLGRQAAHHDTGLFFYCDDVDALHAELTAKGVDAPPPRAAPYGLKNVMVSDPDGYQLVFQGPA